MSVAEIVSSGQDAYDGWSQTWIFAFCSCKEQK
jgi:hypothetical protein